MPRAIAALAGLAVAQFRHERVRVLMAVCGIALAVLSMTLLAGGGAGVLAEGERQFDATDRDLWVTGGPVGLTTAGGGGFENTIQDAHPLTADIETHDEVYRASPLAFQTVYVGTDPDDLDTSIGTGVPGGGGSISLSRGDGFTVGDQHYANGSYDGPRAREVVVDGRTAERYDIDIGDTLHIGGSLSTARQEEFEVVGVSETFSGFLGTSTVTVHLSELQAITGTTGTDSATMISVTLEDGADAEAVREDLQADHPEYEVRTNREQLEQVVASQATVLAGAVLLVGLAVVAGAALAVSLLSLYVYQHREELWTLGALGISRRTVVGLVACQGLAIGVAGWLLGAALTLPLARVLNVVVERVVGYDGLIVVPPAILVGSGAVAVGIGAVAAAVAAWRVPDASA